MSQAENLLNTIAETVPVHTHPMKDQDGYFVIDPDTRTITNASEERSTVMQFDHNSERFTFEVPRYVDGHDMMLCNRVRVHFNCISLDGYEEISDVAEMDDLGLNPDNPGTVISSWLISRNATQLAGILSFLVQYECIDDAGNSVYEWHTDIYSNVDVKLGRNNSEQAIAQYTNILEEWYQKLFGGGESVVESIRVASLEEQENFAQKCAEVLATIPEDYQTTFKSIDNADRTKSDAIVCSARGDVVTVFDSSDDHIRGLKLFGKTTQVRTTGAQLADFASGETNSGVTATFSKDVLKVVGDGSLPYQNYGVDVTDIVVNNTGKILYFTYKTITSTNPMDGRIVQLNVKYTDNTWKYIELVNQDGTKIEYKIPDDVSNIASVSVCIYTTNAVTATANTVTIVEPMLQFGTYEKDYESYSNGVASPSPDFAQDMISVGFGDKITVNVFGKNLCDPSVFERMNVNGSNTTYDYTTHTISMTADSTGHPGRYCQPCRNMKIGQPYTISFDVRGTPGKKLVCGWDQKKVSITLTDEWVRYQDTVIAARSAEPAAFYTIATEFGGLGAGESFQFDNVQVEFGSDATEYEEYKVQQSMTATSIRGGLPGIPVESDGIYTDVNGQQWVCDEIDFGRGVYVKRINEIVIDGTKTVDTDDIEHNPWRKYIWINAEPADAKYGGLCDKLVHKNSVDLIVGNAPSDAGFNISEYHNVIYFNIGHWMASDTVEAAEAALAANPLTVKYVLRNPVETKLTTMELNAFKTMSTNYPSTIVMNAEGAGLELTYNADTKTYLENIPQFMVEAQIKSEVDAWLTARFSSAEGVSF